MLVNELYYLYQNKHRWNLLSMLVSPGFGLSDVGVLHAGIPADMDKYSPSVF